MWELVERAGNYGVPFALMVWVGRRLGPAGWFRRIRTTELGPQRVALMLRALPLYAQPYVSAGTFTGFRRVLDPDAPLRIARYQKLTDALQRVEEDGTTHRPGSTLFLAWSREATDERRTGPLAAGRDLHRLAGAGVRRR